ncbi:MAG: hypothetical protein H6719_07035 [Sandaracinaceae bacterium]|nr:hypothetical protein [Sandaracinaceae bacterium]
MNRRAQLLGLFAALCGATLLFACGGEETTEEPVDSTDHVGLFEIPISLNNQASGPSDAVRIEISPTELRLNYRPVVALEHGRPADTAIADHVITPLREALTSGPARRQAAIRMHANIPYLTFVEVLNTLQSASLRDVLIAVRAPGENPSEAWMQFPHFQVIPAGDEAPVFESRAIPWDEFVPQWQAVYDACRAGQYVNCDGPYAHTAEGGDLEMEMWTRAQGMKVTFRQINAPEPARTGGGGVAMIEGLAPPAVTGGGEPEVTPATEGAFTVRFQESTAADGSAISNMVAPVCADRQCQAIFLTDATAMSMRVISFLGATFPNGTQRPQVAFRLP